MYIPNYKRELEPSVGYIGSETITGTTERTGDFFWITVLDDAVIDTITLDSAETGDAITGTTLIAGTSFPLLCTAIKLTTGKVRMAKRT